MFGFKYSAEHHVLAVVSLSHLHSDKEYEDVLAHCGRLDSDGAWRGRAVGLIVLTDPRTPSPNARWRKRFAEMRWIWRSPQFFNAIVVESMVHRGMFTALNWVKPAPARVVMALHTTATEAIGWLEAQQGTPASVIRELVAIALDTSRSRSAGSTSRAAGLGLSPEQS